MHSDSQVRPSHHVAILSIPQGFFDPHWSEAARGEARDTVVGALQSLLAVTAAGLKEYEADFLTSPSYPAVVAGRMVNEGLMKGYPDSRFRHGRIGCCCDRVCCWRLVLALAEGEALLQRWVS
jgi:hypothetical protein